MNFSKRSLLRAILAIAMIVALPGSLLGGNDLTVHKELRIASSVWDTGVANGANIHGKTEVKVETSTTVESVVMLLLGVCLIFIAVIGKRKFQR